MHDIRTEFFVRVSRTSFLDGELGSSVMGLRLHRMHETRPIATDVPGVCQVYVCLSGGFAAQARLNGNWLLVDWLRISVAVNKCFFSRIVNRSVCITVIYLEAIVHALSGTQIQRYNWRDAPVSCRPMYAYACIRVEYFHIIYVHFRRSCIGTCS